MDDADMAQKIQEQALEIALANQKTKPRKNPTGRCLWCSDATDEQSMFCDADCRDDYEKNKNIRGR